MKLVKKICALVLVITTLNVTLFGAAFAYQTKQISITEMPVEVRSTPAKEIPGKESQSWFGKYKWWILGGVVLVAGGAAAAGGGGGGGDGPDPRDDPGGVKVSW